MLRFLCKCVIDARLLALSTSPSLSLWSPLASVVLSRLADDGEPLESPAVAGFALDALSSLLVHRAARAAGGDSTAAAALTSHAAAVLQPRRCTDTVRRSLQRVRGTHAHSPADVALAVEARFRYDPWCTVQAVEEEARAAGQLTSRPAVATLCVALRSLPPSLLLRAVLPRHDRDAAALALHLQLLHTRLQDCAASLSSEVSPSSTASWRDDASPSTFTLAALVAVTASVDVLPLCVPGDDVAAAALARLLGVLSLAHGVLSRRGASDASLSAVVAAVTSSGVVDSVVLAVAALPSPSLPLLQSLSSLVGVSSPAQRVALARMLLSHVLQRCGAAADGVAAWLSGGDDAAADGKRRKVGSGAKANGETDSNGDSHAHRAQLLSVCRTLTVCAVESAASPSSQALGVDVSALQLPLSLPLLWSLLLHQRQAADAASPLPSSWRAAVVLGHVVASSLPHALSLCSTVDELLARADVAAAADALTAASPHDAVAAAAAAVAAATSDTDTIAADDSVQRVLLLMPALESLLRLPRLAAAWLLSERGSAAARQLVAVLTPVLATHVCAADDQHGTARRGQAHVVHTCRLVLQHVLTLSHVDTASACAASMEQWLKALLQAAKGSAGNRASMWLPPSVTVVNLAPLLSLLEPRVPGVSRRLLLTALRSAASLMAGVSSSDELQGTTQRSVDTAAAAVSATLRHSEPTVLFHAPMAKTTRMCAGFVHAALGLPLLLTPVLRSCRDLLVALSLHGKWSYKDDGAVDGVPTRVQPAWIFDRLVSHPRFSRCFVKRVWSDVPLLVDVLRVLVDKDPNCASADVLVVVLCAYDASLSDRDRSIRALAQLYETESRVTLASVGYVWGVAAQQCVRTVARRGDGGAAVAAGGDGDAATPAADFVPRLHASTVVTFSDNLWWVVDNEAGVAAVGSGTPASTPDAAAATGIDPARVVECVDTFPIHRSLTPPLPPLTYNHGAAAVAAVDDAPALPPFADVEGMDVARTYDPSFVLPALVQALSAGHVLPRKFVSAGGLSLAVMALTSSSRDVRAFGYDAIALFSEQLSAAVEQDKAAGCLAQRSSGGAASVFREALQVHTCVQVLRGSVPAPFARMPAFLTAFVAMTLQVGLLYLVHCCQWWRCVCGAVLTMSCCVPRCQVILQPSHALYTILNKVGGAT